ncbi:MAG: cysteine--tRNA ligase [Chloroflexi bacterium]|nr:cysteine--tRNA ligase [Chloroflexota bacterium]
MTLRIYNTLTRRTEDFQPLEPGRVTMYVCGPTVYGGAHVGHGMSSLVFDIVRRYLVYRGYEVRYAMNYTDVDDKIIQRAKQEGEPPLELAERYIEEYDQQLKALSVLPATVYPRATAEIPYIIDMVARLLEDDAAYVVDGDVYYRVEKDDDYGKLSGRRLEDMHAGARIDVDERKEHPMDFAVWKAAKPGEPAWDSPWGPGRPGWHIECSAMVFHHLGQQIDIHGGGNDLIFPHHENEIAQSESLTGKPFARYWMHNGLMQFSGEKMSRSLGNLISIKAFLEKHEPDVLRMMVLNSSYRHPLTYGDEIVEGAARGLERLRSGLRPALPGATGAPKTETAALAKLAEETRTRFIEAMDDDFNTAAVLGLLFELVRQINQVREVGATNEQMQGTQAVLFELSGVLGLRLKRQEKNLDAGLVLKIFDELRKEIDAEMSQEIRWPTAGGENGNTPQLIDMLLDIRDVLRAKKLWKLTDQIRDGLAKLGVLVEDSAGGSSWRWE